MTAGLDTLILRSYERLCKAHPDMDCLTPPDESPFAQALWREVEQMGLPGLLSDYEGELDHPERTALALAQLTGYYCVPLPVVENMIARALLRMAGIEAPDGLLALAVVEGASIDHSTAPELNISGKVVVPWGRHAGHLVLAAEAGGQQFIALVPSVTPGVEVAHGRNLAGEPRDPVVLTRAKCTARAMPGAVETASMNATRYRAALMAGAAESALDMTIEYVSNRTQFGKPLGKNQAVQQALAGFAGELAGALSACSLAFSSAMPKWRTVAIAKMRCDVAATIGCNVTHQAHGAIGVTAEYPLHLRTQRLWSWRAENGSGASWARRLGQDFIARGADGLWPAITSMR